MGGWKIIDPETGAKVIIEKLDLFHSLLGEMKPGNLKECVKGGHLLIPELRAATLEIGEMTTFGDGFLDMAIKVKSEKKINSVFLMGTSLQESVDIVKNALKNYKEIIIEEFKGKVSIDVQNKSKQWFRLSVKNNIAKFHPLNPLAVKKR